MTFRELNELEQAAFSGEAVQYSFHEDLLRDYIDKERRKENAQQEPFTYFCEDVTEQKLLVDFLAIIGAQSYKSASNDALVCLDLCTQFSRLSKTQAPGWLDSALKFIDHLVLHYIQEVKQTKPRRYKDLGIERSRYRQLSDLDAATAHTGNRLNDLYMLRNELQHRTIIHADGSQTLLSPPLGRIRRQIGKWYPDVLKRMVGLYAVE